MQIIGTPLLHDPSQKVTVGCPPGFCWSRTDPLLQQPFATPGLNSRIRSLALLPFCFIFSLSVNLPLGCLIPDSLLCGRLSQEAVVYSWTVPCSTDLNPTMDLCLEQPLPSVTKKKISPLSFFPPSLLYSSSFKGDRQMRCLCRTSVTTSCCCLLQQDTKAPYHLSSA